MLCSAPNWYQGCLCDCSSKGIVAIGTQNWITLLSVTPSIKNSLNKNDHVFVGELLGHKDRIQCCKFSFFSSNILTPNEINDKSSSIELLVSGSSDCSIRIWNIETKKCIIIFKSEYNDLYPITALTTNNSNLIIFGDSKGFITCWNPITNNQIRKKISDSSVMSLKICINDTNQIAVGYKSGNVLLLNIDENNINELCRFIGHDSDIQGLSWCHKYNINNINDKSSSNSSSKTIIDYLPNVFATTSRDKFIKFWNTLNGQCLIEIEIGKYDKKQSSQQRIWYTLLWLTPFKLFVSESNGKIWCINLKNITIQNEENKSRKIRLSLDIKDNNNRLPKNTLTTFTQGHSRCVFNIIPIKNRPQHLLTISLDRNIIYWDINTQKPLWNISCIGGYVYDLDFAPWNPSLLAIAVGDKMIRVWNVSGNILSNKESNNKYIINPLYNLNNFENKTKKRSKSDPYHCRVIWRGLKDKITTIKWHPTDIGWLVYGTDKGNIGCINVNSNSKSSHCKLLSYHENFVTKVDWKIIAIKYRNDYNMTDITIESGFRIYSLGKDGQILESDGWKANKPSININKYIIAANSNINDILKTSSQNKISWTSFCIELMNPYQQQKYKEIVKTIKNDNDNNDNNDNINDIDINDYTGQKMIIGSSNGLIYILNGDWKLLCSLNDYNSLITCIQINPFYNITNYNNDKYKNLIAVGTVDGNILFYDISNIESNTELNIINKVKHSTKNKAINKIKWHPFESNIFVSISNDKQNPFYIWRITMKQEKMKIEKLIEIKNEINDQYSWFTYCHHLKWLSVEWSHNDPFVIYSASQDQTCRRINLKDIISNKNDDISYQNLSSLYSLNSKIKSEGMTVKLISNKDKIKKLPISSAINKQQKQINVIKHQKLFQSFSNEKIENEISKLWQLIKYYTYLIQDEDEKEDEKINEQIDFKISYDILLLHIKDISKKDISDWISSILQKQESGLYPNQLLSSMCYQMQNLIENNSEIIIKRELNKFNEKKEKSSIPKLPSLLSLLMAPTFGRKEWIKTMLNLCEYYKHPSIGLYHNAASIYLSLNLPQCIYECINMYCKIDYFYEALIIAKYYLLPNHPIIKKILCLYAEKLLSKKKYIAAIKCYLATLSIYYNDKQEYIKQFNQIMIKYVFKLLIKHYFTNNLQSEYKRFILIKKPFDNKRKIGNNDIYPLILIYDIIDLLSNISYININDYFKSNQDKENINDIFSMYWLIKLCIYSQCKNINTLSINKWPLKTKNELFLWKSLFYFTQIMDIDKYQNQIIELKLENNNNNIILSTYYKLNFTFRINHICDCYLLQIQHNQTKRIHCVKFANFLLHCHLYHISLLFEENTEKLIIKFDEIIWESFNYAFTQNLLLLFHQYLGYILSFWKENELINLSNSYIVTKLIFDTFNLISNIDNNEINIKQLIIDYLKIIYKYEAMNELLKCKIIIKYFVLCLSKIKITENIKNIFDKKLWIIIDKIIKDSNINTIETLIEKYNKIFKISHKKLKDPYLNIV